MLVSWSFDAVGDKARFVVNASEAVGWIGFGFALQAPNNMNDYDVIMAGYHVSQGGYIYVSVLGYLLRVEIMSETSYRHYLTCIAILFFWSKPP